MLQGERGQSRVARDHADATTMREGTGSCRLRSHRRYRETGDRLVSIQTTLTLQGERGQSRVATDHADATTVREGNRLVFVETILTLQQGERGQSCVARDHADATRGERTESCHKRPR